MKHFVEFKLEDGTPIVFEVDEPEVGGTTRASRRPGEIEQAKETLEEALTKVRPTTERVIATLHTLSQRPDEIEMEFGFNLSATAGVVIAAASTEANYKVTLRWKSKQESQ
jgi:hypothetical protein